MQHIGKYNINSAIYIDSSLIERIAGILHDEYSIDHCKMPAIAHIDWCCNYGCANVWSETFPNYFESNVSASQKIVWEISCINPLLTDYLLILFVTVQFLASAPHNYTSKVNVQHSVAKLVGVMWSKLWYNMVEIETQQICTRNYSPQTTWELPWYCHDRVALPWCKCNS